MTNLQRVDGVRLKLYILYVEGGLLVDGGPGLIYRPMGLVSMVIIVQYEDTDSTRACQRLANRDWLGV